MLGVFSVYEWTRGTQGSWTANSRRTGKRPGQCLAPDGMDSFFSWFLRTGRRTGTGVSMGWHWLFPPRSRERVSAGHRLVVPPAAQTFPVSEPFRDSQTRNMASSIAPRIRFSSSRRVSARGATESKRDGFRGTPGHSRRDSDRLRTRKTLGNAEPSRGVPVDSESGSGYGSGEGIA